MKRYPLSAPLGCENSDYKRTLPGGRGDERYRKFRICFADAKAGRYGGLNSIDARKATGYNVYQMEIRNFVHKGLRKLYMEDSVKGLPPDAVDKLRAMLTYLQDMQDPEKLRAFPLWKAHRLTGDHKGVWSLHVTRNWRLTFRIKDGQILDVDYEDYH
jgi:proteic killer suppression protein